MNIKTFEELLQAIDEIHESSLKKEGVETEIYAFIQIREAEFLEISVAEFRSRVLNILNTMKEAVSNGLNSNELSKSGLSGENTGIVKNALEEMECGYLQKATNGNEFNIKEGRFSTLSSVQKKLMLYTFSIIEENARMGKIAACPTAGSCGIVPGVLYALSEELNLDNEKLINALITAGTIGEIVSYKMALAGAVAGCQAECGVGAAMAAGAACYIMGGSNEQILNAAALSLKNILGLTCDPVAGLVEVPCVKRNIFMGMHALTAAELSLFGVKSKIPLDEIVDAMKETGDLMSNRLKESSEAGLAKTKSGIFIESMLKERFRQA